MTVIGSKKLGKSVIALVSPQSDGTLVVVAPPMTLGKDLAAYYTLDVAEPMTLRAVATNKDFGDLLRLPQDWPIVANSQDFNLTKP